MKKIVLTFILGAVFVNSAPAFNIAKKADYFYSRGRFNFAISLYEKMLKANPRDVALYLNMALIYKDRADYPKAVYFLKKALKYKNFLYGRILLGRLYYLWGKSYKAIEVLRPLLSAKNKEVYLLFALAQDDLGNTNKAAAYYQKVLSQDPANITALKQLGLFYFKREDYKKAEGYFSSLVEFEPNIQEAYYYLGLCFLYRGDFSKAYLYLKKAELFFPFSKQTKDYAEDTRRRLGSDYFARKKKDIDTYRLKKKLLSYTPVVAKKIPLVRVALANNLKKISQKSASNFVILNEQKKVQFRGKAKKAYSIRYKQGYGQIESYPGGIVLAKISFPCRIINKNKKAPFLVFGISSGGKNYWHKTVDFTLRGKLSVISRKNNMLLVNIINLEEYLYGVVPAEMPPTANIEALKAQAVIARTFAYKTLMNSKGKDFDFSSDTNYQVYQGRVKEHWRSNKAIDATRGEGIFFGGRPIEALYHANCGGCLRTDVFQRRSYFRRGFDWPQVEYIYLSPLKEESFFKRNFQSFCSHVKHKASFRWQKVIDTTSGFYSNLEKIRKLEILEKGDCGYVKRIKAVYLNGREKVISGDLAIRRFLGNLRSSLIKIEQKLSPLGVVEKIFIYGAGFGHGEGLCQQGAMEMGQKGYDYRQILHHYYKGIEIKKLY